IGINSDEVYIGDLGDSRKVDFTLIGNGVNFAQRLEAACDPYSILIGASCKDAIFDPDHLNVRLVKKYIQIKHHDDLREAWEIDPFVDRSRERTKALNAFRDYVGISRIETRWLVPDDMRIDIETSFGKGHLVNFSESGF